MTHRAPLPVLVSEAAAAIFGVVAVGTLASATPTVALAVVALLALLQILLIATGPGRRASLRPKAILGSAEAVFGIGLIVATPNPGGPCCGQSSDIGPTLLAGSLLIAAGASQFVACVIERTSNRLENPESQGRDVGGSNHRGG